jgi:hypothetical protein
MTYEREKLRELIPLYVNKTLSEDEQREFENSIKKHPELEREFKEFSEIRASYVGLEKDMPKPSDAVYQRIAANIKADEKRRIPEEPGILSKVRELMGEVFASYRVSWAVVAVQLVVIIILAGVMTRGERFTTLSTTYPPLKGEGISINIVFDQEAREKEIRAILNRIGAAIISGPSREGLYVIQVKKDKDVEQTLEKLKSSHIVKFAQKAYQRKDDRKPR